MRACRATLLLLLLLGAGACRKTPGGELPPPPSSVVVIEDSLVLKHGGIGIEDRQEASYALVDAENNSGEPRLVSLEGELLDAGGKRLGTLYIDELYVPAGGRRTFALVATGAFPEATKARAWVRHAPVAKDPQLVAIDSHALERDGADAVCRVTIKSAVDKEAMATTFCSFYDRDGKLLARPFKILGLGPNGSQSWGFTGPPTATRVEPFVGQIVY